MSQLHEDLRREHVSRSSSPRSFGILFAVVFLVIGLTPLRVHGAVRWWAIAVAAVFAVITLAAPAMLSKPHQLWMAFSALLAKITNPIFTSALFYLIVFPFGAVLRMAGVDLLARRPKAGTKSYWIDSTVSGERGSMARQF